SRRSWSVWAAGRAPHPSPRPTGAPGGPAPPRRCATRWGGGGLRKPRRHGRAGAGGSLSPRRPSPGGGSFCTTRSRTCSPPQGGHRPPAPSPPQPPEPCDGARPRYALIDNFSRKPDALRVVEEILRIVPRLDTLETGIVAAVIRSRPVLQLAIGVVLVDF